MPADEDIDAAVAKDSADAAAAGQEAVASAIPEAEEPLKAAVVNSLGQSLGKSIERLTKGQMPAPAFTPVEGDLPSVPPAIAGPVMAIGAMTQEMMGRIPQLEPYAFDGPAMLATNAGLQEVGAIIDEMSRDRDLVKALSAKGTAPEDEAEVDTDTDTDTEPEEPAEEE